MYVCIYIYIYMLYKIKNTAYEGDDESVKVQLASLKNFRSELRRHFGMPHRFEAVSNSYLQCVLARHNEAAANP